LSAISEGVMHMDETMAFLMPRGGGGTMLAAVNEHLAVAGLSITREDALMLAERRVESLAETERIEFGPPAVAAIAKAIASSPFLMQDNLADVLAELQDAFYALRDELPVDVPDAEIVEALGDCFDTHFAAHEVPCDIDYQPSKPVNPQLLGLDYIEAWLAQLLAETRWIAQFDAASCVNVLERACPDYKGLHVNLYDLLLPHENELARTASRARQT
jgi:hypothetical protein